MTIARWGADGVLTLWTSTMGPHTVRGMMAELLDLPLGRVRVITQMVGGGYGSKMYLRAINPAVALLAMKLPGRHVRMLFDREDEFLSCNGRLPTRDHDQDRGCGGTARWWRGSPAWCGRRARTPTSAR